LKSLDLLKKEVEKLTVKNDAAHDFEHIMRVYRNTKKLCKSEEANPKLVLCAALLHDTIEDCGVTKETLEREFNPNIARIVAQLTKDVDRESYKERIRKADFQVQIMKLADTVHNCSEMTHSNITQETIRRKVDDCNSLYLDLAKKISPNFYNKLCKHLTPFDK
jgi:(p)ppGpp synthase/HD superfamily hydrolase